MFAIAFALLSLPFSSFGISNDFSNANSTTAVNYSIFIRNPSFSTIYNNNIYFFDEYDNYLKIYNTTTRTFVSNYISLSDYNVVDMSSHKNALFFVATKDEKQYLLAINLDTLSMTQIELISTGYVRIFATKLTINTAEKFIIALTHDVSVSNAKPAVLVLDNNFVLETNSSVEFNLGGNDESLIAINENLFKFLIVESESHQGELLFVFVYKNFVSFTDGITSSNLESQNIVINRTAPATASLETTDAGYDFYNVNLIDISGKSYFYITYMNKKIRTNTIVPILYEYELDGINNTTFTLKKHLENIDCNSISTNYDYCIYSHGQMINYVKYEYNEQTQTFSDLSGSVLNPEITISYSSSTELNIKTTNKETAIYSTPWNSSPIITLQANYDIIFIGVGYIEVGNVMVSDYLYCFCTINDTNITGYIKASDVTNKMQVSVDDYEYKVVKAVPNTNLYSYPTKILTQVTADNIQIGVVSQIVENSKVEIIDPICRYTANGSKFVKVKVNDTEVGYIDYSNIIAPSKSVDFIETNASIKNDNTYVYLSTEENSPVIYKLNKNYRVRINGTRDTKTGYTSITFNDEYGNEFSGYIVTDTLGADSWSTLQIIGCVLIAINVGLLILILLFRKHKIGNNGTKYLQNEKENYKK